jgi:antitoxin (DNA-binding transcriptional repressor) of toxin-antitoxin stability system
MKDALQVSIRDLRLNFPQIRRQIEEYGEVVVTDNGVPSYLLKRLSKQPQKDASPVDYWARIVAQQPNEMSANDSQALLDENRGDR